MAGASGGIGVEGRAVSRGRPSYVWRFGQRRRFDLIRRYVEVRGRRVLDVGCGLGAYVARFQELTPHAYGVDLDAERVRRGRRGVPDLMVAAGESLPFVDACFDLVLLHEVIEHVDDDRAVLAEALRVTREGGAVVVFCPNRLYPFETHGFYLGRRYVFRLLPLVNYLPGALRRRLVPHARAYLWRDLHRLVEGLPAKVAARRYVYPGFDNIAARRPALAAVFRRLCYFLEGTPLAIFGLSHFVVLRKERLLG